MLYELPKHNLLFFYTSYFIFRNLQDRDTFSKSDPICVFFTKDVRSNSWYEVSDDETSDK